MAPAPLQSPPDETPAIARIHRNFAAYDDFARRAEAALKRGALDAAAGYVSLAAWVGAHMHCGFFAGPRLERVLLHIGRRIATNTPPPRSAAGRQRVLHIATEVSAMGGHGAMLRRWIESDPNRIHSIALTQQVGAPPQALSVASAATGGSIVSLSARPGLVAAVEALRAAAVENDIIVLHISNSDVIPTIAFAETGKFPPIVFLNHADHMFWLGSSISWVVGGMRDAAMQIAEQRRYIAHERSMLVPILVPSAQRNLARVEAKAKLGLSPETILLVSVARSVKYRTLDGETYADTHAEVLAKHPNAVMMVVGADERPDWTPAAEKCGGRIQALSPRDPRPYLDAADIYCDSYPFSSATSMMEAACYEIACIGRFYRSDEARICGMDHPGLWGEMVEARDRTSYLRELERLILDEDFRAERGRAIAQSVTRVNVSPGWNSFVEAAFARAAELGPVDNTAMFGDARETPFEGQPDILLEDIYGSSPPIADLVKGHLRRFGAGERLKLWRETLKAGAFKDAKEAARGLFPEWLIRALRD
jgi:hypothetical protein